MLTPVLLRNSPERIFESLYKRHVKDVYRYSLAMLDRQVDAEDATQTTFMNAYRALERGERPRDAAPWLRAIALNVCREHYRRAGRRLSEVSLDDDPGELVVDPPAPELGDVLRGLSCLPFNQRTALVMREFEGRSLREIAAELEVSTSAVETLLFRARRALREQLDATLTCSEAERSISRQLDGTLTRQERGALRAHLRACTDCASLARRLRAQRSSIRSLGALIPLPASLRLFKLAGGGAGSAPAATAAGAGSASGGSVLAALTFSAAGKVVAATAVGVAALGVGYASLPHHAAHRAPSRAVTISAAGRVPGSTSAAPGGVAARLAGTRTANPGLRLGLRTIEGRFLVREHNRRPAHARALGSVRALSHRTSRRLATGQAISAHTGKPAVSRGVAKGRHGRQPGPALSARSHSRSPRPATSPPPSLPPQAIEHGQASPPGNHGRGH